MPIADWILGGDFNAELATDDFDALLTGGMVPISAADETGGAFSYIKAPFKSLIDHIFLSPNLATQFGEADYFIVAAEQTFPDYMDKISDHRPVVLRMSRGGGNEAVSAAALESVVNPALNELKQLLNLGGPALETGVVTVQYETTGIELERGRRPRTRPRDGGSGRRPDSRAGSGFGSGFDPGFLGGGDFEVPIPLLSSGQQTDAAVVSSSSSGMRKYVLDYTHFSVVMNGTRRMPFYSICNIDGTQARNVPRGDDWRFDTRISETLQCGNDIYRNNDLDKGHMTRRLDPVWGSAAEASRANNQTFFYTNACPQHKDLNQREWNELEDYVLNNSATHNLQVCVATGPILTDDDRPYRGIQIPLSFWKVVVMRRTDTGRLSATGYVLTQEDMISGLEFVFGPFKTYQVSLAEIAARTGLDFGRLASFAPLRARTEGLESTAPITKLIRGAEDLRL